MAPEARNGGSAATPGQARAGAWPGARARTAGAGALAAAVLLAGCLGMPAGDSAEPLGADAATGAGAGSAEVAGWEVAMEGCRLGGGHTLYNMRTLEGHLPEPWVMADVRDDVGEPLVLTLGNPNLGDGLAGIYHAGLVCDAWAVDGAAQQGPLQGGIVGMRVEPPHFDPGGADRHYLIAALSFHDGALRERVAGLGLHVSPGTARVGPEGPLFRALLDDSGHGVSDALWVPKESGSAEPRVTRLWMLQGGDGHGHEDGDRDGDGAGEELHGGYRPVSVDLVQASPAGHVLAEQGTGYYSHTRTDNHWPLPGGYGNAAGLAFMGWDGALRPGPAPEVVLQLAWGH